MLVELAVISAFLGTLLLTLGFFGGRPNPVRARVRNLTGYAEERNVDPGTRSFKERVVRPFLEGVGNTLATQLPAGVVGRIRELLMMAGQPLTVTNFMGLTVLSGLGAAGLVLATMMLFGAGIGSVQLIILLVFFVLGLFGPFYWLKRGVGKRQLEITKSLPNSLDLITTCVEAGLGLDAAFAKVAEKVPGPFAEELSQALREATMGRSRRDALQDISRRTGVRDVTTFINSIVHAQATGANIGDVLRTQADQIRMKQRQRVEETAQKMPIWMTFPLILCMLPALFIVILGPAGITVFQRLGED